MKCRFSAWQSYTQSNNEQKKSKSVGGAKKRINQQKDKIREKQKEKERERAREEGRRKWKKKEFRRQTSVGRCCSGKTSRSLFLSKRHVKSSQDGKKRDGIKERTNIERDGSAYKALLRLVFISNRASVECDGKSLRNELWREERKRVGEEKKSSEKSAKMYSITREVCIRISRLVFPRVVLRSTLVATALRNTNVYLVRHCALAFSLPFCLLLWSCLMIRAEKITKKKKVVKRDKIIGKYARSVFKFSAWSFSSISFTVVAMVCAWYIRNFLILGSILFETYDRFLLSIAYANNTEGCVLIFTLMLNTFASKAR